MAEFPLKIEKIAGLADETGATGAFAKRVNLADGSLGTVVACILVKSEKEQDFQTLLADLFEIICKKIEDGSEGALAAVAAARDGVAAHAPDYEGEVSLGLAFFYKSACFLAEQGKDIKIWVFEPPKSVEITFDSGSGPQKTGQVYLLASVDFLSMFDKAILEQGGIELEEVIDGLATEISAKEDQSALGAVFVEVKGETEEGENLAEVQEPPEEKQGLQAIEEEAKIGQKEEAVGGRIKGVGSLILGLAVKVIGEIKSLKGGDIRAVFRLRRNIALVAALSAVILVGSVGWTIWQKGQQAKGAQFNNYLAQATSRYNEATAIMELNKARARELLIDADQQLKLALAIDSSDQKARELAGAIEANLKETETTESVNFEVVTEANEPLNSLAAASKTIFGFGESKILQINNQKEVSEISGLTGVRSGIIFDNKAFVLAGDNVVRVDLSKNEKREIIERGDAFDIGVFFGNIYLLKASQIGKLVPIEAGYASQGDYLNQNFEFGEGARMAIDGSIWVATGDKIYKFSRGSREQFEISGLTSEGFKFGPIYTGSDLADLYVIDIANSALLIIGKDGVYKKAYQGSEFARASDLVVNSSGDKVYLAVDNKILSASIE